MNVRLSLFTIYTALGLQPSVFKSCRDLCLLISGGFRVVPRVPWNPSFMKELIILYYDKLTRSVGPVDYIALMEPPTS